MVDLETQISLSIFSMRENLISVQVCFKHETCIIIDSTITLYLNTHTHPYTGLIMWESSFLPIFQ